MNKTILSLFDYSGNWSRPYYENGYNVIQIDVQLNYDIMNWNYKTLQNECVYGILAAVPCTDFALCGAKHFEKKDKDGTTNKSIELVRKTLEIIQYFTPHFWVIENPRTRIHKCVPELGEVKHRFNPCDYAQYDPIPGDSRYNKTTWLWGDFTIPDKGFLPPLTGGLARHSKKLPSNCNYLDLDLARKNFRSKTPLGFAYAFYNANK